MRLVKAQGICIKHDITDLFTSNRYIYVYIYLYMYILFGTSGWLFVLYNSSTADLNSECPIKYG